MLWIVSDGRLATRLDALAVMLDAVTGATVQVREKALSGRDLLALVRSVVAIARPRGARVLVNDRADVAIAAGADGVHLPENGMSVADARGLGVSFVSVSRHAASASASGADAVILGPIWDTPGKGPALGVAALAAARIALPPSCALVAIGGVDSAARAREARVAGADAVAAIRALWDASDPGATATELA